LINGKKVRDLRTILGLSAAKLSEMSGVSLQTIYNVEHEKVDPTLDVITKIAEALKVPVDELMADTDEDTPNVRYIHHSRGKDISQEGDRKRKLEARIKAERSLFAVKHLLKEPRNAKLMFENAEFDVPEDLVDEFLIRILSYKIENSEQ
jgi:transcriptional regulator with XRE-family HTH domain